MTPLAMKEFLQSYPSLTDGIKDDDNALVAFNLIAQRAGFRAIDENEPASVVFDELHEFIFKNVNAK